MDIKIIDSLRSSIDGLKNAIDTGNAAAVAEKHEKFDQLELPQDFRRWAFGVARFEALAFRRDRARDRHVFSEDLISLLEAEATEAGEQSDREEQALQGCLKKLPKAQRELVEVAYAPGARIDELAREAGRTPMALYKSLHRIRMALAACIRESLQHEEGLA